VGRTIDLDTWKRREHFRLFRDYDRPHFSITAAVDVSACYAASRGDEGASFTLAMLFNAMRAANAVEAFRLRLREDGVWCHDAVGIGCTVLRADRTFGFAYFAPETSFTRFAEEGKREMDRARTGATLGDEREDDDATLHATVLPWVRFTSFTNAMRREDSVPKITFGKRYAEGGAWYVPVCVEVHHALVDGIDVGEFFQHFQDLLAEPLPG
jgi:chloramphenicol O-acetyltransferase type A